MVLDDPVAPIELAFVGTANTGGDLIAWLPRQRVLFAGDTVVAPSPYGFNANTRSWIAVLEKYEALNFAVLIPGHGAVQRDPAYLDAMIWSMQDVRAQVAKAIRSGKSAEQTWAAFDKTPHVARFTAGSDGRGGGWSAIGWSRSSTALTARSRTGRSSKDAKGLKAARAGPRSGIGDRPRRRDP